MDSFKFFRGYTDVNYRIKIAMDELTNTMSRLRDSMDEFNKRFEEMMKL